MSSPPGKIVNESLVFTEMYLYSRVNLITPATNRQTLNSTPHNVRIPYKRLHVHVCKACVPDGVIPHDVPGQVALAHRVGQVSRHIVDGRDVLPPRGWERYAAMDTEHLGADKLSNYSLQTLTIYKTK